MSILSKLFGRKSETPATAPAAKGEEYKGYRIIPQPALDGKSYRIGALIEKEVEGTLRQHHLIRADTLSDYDGAAEASIGKAKVMIDQQGDRLFN